MGLEGIPHRIEGAVHPSLRQQLAGEDPPWEPPIRENVTTPPAEATMAKLREELAAAVMGLVGENVALICSGLARAASGSRSGWCTSTASTSMTVRCTERKERPSGVPKAAT